MTRVNFYILGDTQESARLQFACRLIQQAVTRQKCDVLVQVDDEAQARALDELLWVFQPDAFVPHALLDPSGSIEEAPVHIGWHNDPGPHHQLLVNLSTQLPAFFARFERLSEVVVQQQDVLHYTREHYRHLRDRGYPITDHDMR
ncbi:DNA polymerase III subunit chi [Bacterioplanes sanyensis]|uniref:DNA polymerase III subunit chi n=1 Tax=Bacterioplanes sanyensis TaxID=1249553 RepID=UPI0012FE49ED|nr:DNA polymerase III subunit chi [Bacterioplanes sanyensis]